MTRPSMPRRLANRTPYAVPSTARGRGAAAPREQRETYSTDLSTRGDVVAALVTRPLGDGRTSRVPPPSLVSASTSPFQKGDESDMNSRKQAHGTTIARRTVLGGLAAGPVAVILPATSASAAGWSWAFLTINNDIWMRNSLNGTARFDFRLGGGGCIAQMRYAPNGFEPLLSPTAGSGEETDRVMQSVLWGVNVVADDDNFPNPRWNINQAGNNPGQFSRVVEVLQPTAATTDVYTIADLQWRPQLEDDFAGSDTVPQLTRYTRMAGGVLQISRIVRLPKVFNGGVEVNNVTFRFLNWLPYRRSAAAFSALALGLAANGAPTWWYRAGDNLPFHPNFLASETNGYAAVYKEGAHSSTRVAGTVFSQGAGQTFSTTASIVNRLDMMDWGTGIGVLPVVFTNNTETDSILQYSIRIVTHPASNGAFVTKLQNHAAVVPEPVLYGPSHTFSGQLADIVDTLRDLVTSSAGTRTNHLAPLLA